MCRLYAGPVGWVNPSVTPSATRPGAGDSLPAAGREWPKATTSGCVSASRSRSRTKLVELAEDVADEDEASGQCLFPA
jgi:hypothetical protein